MKELKKMVTLEFKKFVDNLIEVLQTAQETGEGIDAMKLVSIQGEHYGNLSKYFDEAEMRYKEKPKAFVR